MTEKKWWLASITCIYAVAVVCLTVATFDQDWYQVSCGGVYGPENHQLQVGLWAVCSRSKQNQSNGRINFCGRIYEVINEGRLPGWMKGTQLLAFANMVASAVMVVLMLGYCMVPLAVALDAVGGFAASAAATVAISLTTILNATIALEDLQNWISTDICRVTDVRFSLSFYLTVCACLLALIPSIVGVYMRHSYPPEMVERLKNQSSGSLPPSTHRDAGNRGQGGGGLKTKMFATFYEGSHAEEDDEEEFPRKYHHKS